jgi:hypothetical protein
MHLGSRRTRAASPDEEVRMSRLSLVAVALFPVLALGGDPAVSPGEAKPARPEVRPVTFQTPPVVPYGQAPLAPGYTYYGLHLQTQLWWDRHECAPDGCPKPIGCGNFWTEKKFVFGSCRQFFGTADSAVGHRYQTTIRER